MLRRSLVTAAVAALIVLAPPAAAADDDRPQAWVGIMMTGVEGAADTDGPAGVGVRYVMKDSPAEEAGLRARDVIVGLDGGAVASPADLLARLRQLDPGAWVGINVRRGERELDLDLRVDTRPASMRNTRIRRGFAGLKAIDLPDTLREHFGAPADAGVMLSEVAAAGPAEAGGLRIGDVVTAVDGEPVGSTKVLTAMLAGGGVGNTLEATVMRDGVEAVIEVVLIEAPEGARGW